MKTMLAVVLLMGVAWSQTPTKHGYELAKTWDDQQAKFEIRFAEMGPNELDNLEYKSCVLSAQEFKAFGKDGLGPQTRTKYKCDARIDEQEKHLAKLNADRAK